ncbi:MAG TPA: Rieske (2Fe-2S) protein [Polyangia bacterium]|nr:Rieske (2Fe-2S) protein [Polyangia bacterium]
MTSTITFLGHAGLDVRLGSARVVCNPWLSTRGAYLGNWHQFPANDHLRAEDLHDAPTLFVGSPRPDHCDLDTLGAFPRSAQVVIPKLASPALGNRVRELGFAEVRELADGETLELADGARLSLLTSTTRHLLGATLILERDGEVIVDQDDCLLDDAALEKLAALEPAVHLLRFSGSSYHPAAYELPPEAARAEAARETDRLAQRFFEVAAKVGGRHVVPIGGPPCVVDERGFALASGDGAWFDAEALAARAAGAAPEVGARLRLVSPGDVAVGEGGDWRFPGRPPTADPRASLEAYRRARAPLREAHLAQLRAGAAPVDTKELRAYLRDFFQFEDMTAELKMIVQFRLPDGPSVWIDFRNKPYRYLTECDEAATYVLTVDSAWVSLVLQGKLTWHELLMGGQMTVTRDPARDAPKLMQHFDYRHDEALFDLVRIIDPALITVQDEKMEYVCQRFCPHRGRDLDYAIVERGVLTCTAHGWRFDLRKGGRCLWGGETPLLVKEMRPLKP